MRYIDSIPVKDKALLITIVVISIIVLAAIISVFVAFNGYFSKHTTRVRSKSNTTTVYVLDIANDTAIFCNSAKLRERKKVSLTSFYNSFSSKNRESLITWVNSLLDNAETKKYIEVTKSLGRKKKSLVYVLQVEKVDIEKSLIYLECHTLNYLNKPKKKKQIVNFVSKEVFLENYRLNKSNGITLCLNFFNKNTKINGIEHIYYVEIKNILGKMISNSIIMMVHGDNKFIISNFDISMKEDIEQFTESLKNKINSFLMIESLSNEIGFSIGCSENHFFTHEFNELIKTVDTLSESAKDGNVDIIYFDESSNNIGDEHTFKTEIENIIENNKLNYFYQAIYDTENNKLLGYYSSIKYSGDVFKNITELKNFAIRTDDDKKLFSSISKNTVNNFAQEKTLSALKLFVPISANDYQYIDSILLKFSRTKEINLVLVFNENDILNIDSDSEGLDNLANLIRQFKSMGNEIGIFIDSQFLNLQPSMYSLFDYFVISIKDQLGTDLSKNIPIFRSLIEELLKYKKKIISSEVQTWDMLELVYKFGIGTVCGDGLAIANENVLPLDRKVIQKIKKIIA